MSPAIPEMERYRQITPGSRALWERATRVLPGGDTRSSIYWRSPRSAGLSATWEVCASLTFVTNLVMASSIPTLRHSTSGEERECRSMSRTTPALGSATASSVPC